MKTLSTSVKTTRVSNAVAAGTSLVTSSIVDTQGYDTTRFEVLLGSITTGGNLRIHVQQGSQANLSDAEELEGYVDLTDTDDNKVAILEVIRPSRRYLRVRVTRGIQNSVIDGILALQYSARNMPTTDDVSTIKARSISVTPDVDN
jgi:hypothetical protein